MPKSAVRRAIGIAGTSSVLLVAPLAVPPAAATNADHADRLVSKNPADNTPQVMNGSVNALTQVGNKIIAAGTFTSVSPAATFSNTSDDVVRNRIFAFDATTGAIDPSFNPNLGGAANSLDTDGTSIYVGGAFGSVGGSTAIKRVVKLSAAGVVDQGFKAVPNKAVTEVVARSGRLYVGGDFTSIKRGTATAVRGALAALDPATGAVAADVDVPFTGVYDPAIGGGTGIKRLDVTADGSKLVAVGNFSTVGGQPRSQVAVLNTPAGGTAAVAGWATNRFDAAHNDCASVFDSFTRDVDFSPDGSYFVVTTTGAFAGGAGSGTMCDATTRWETTSAGNDPTWTNYTGGDTTYGVAVTGAAVYVGGHMRWQNNSFQGDQAGPGAVPREGIAALDPVNGLPLSWNPGRSRGVGAQALLATSAGLWVGSDTTRLGRETHGRVAFLPLSGGTTIPSVAPARLPNDLFLAQRAPGTASNVLHRLNAGGPALQGADGSDWRPDTGLVAGGSTADWGATVPRDTTVPSTTAPDIFATERYGNQDWNLPVTEGARVTVRLYFANQCGCTSAVGKRVFDVLVDDQVVLDDFDIVAAAGDKTGTMRSVVVTTDGDGLDIDLRSIVENPLVNGIEVLDNDVSPTAGSAGALERRAVDATGAPTGPAAIANTTMDWATVRGAFYLSGTVYYGLADGGLYRRTFNPSRGVLGAQSAVNLYDDPETGERIPFRIANLTGMFYDTETHRIYYTVFGDARLLYRYFTPESRVVGAQTFVADGAGVDFSAVAGMTLAGGRILYGSSADGSLRSVGFAGGAVTGGPSVLSADGTWRHRAIFVPN